MKLNVLAPIVVEILLWQSRGFGSHKRLKRPEASGAGLAPETYSELHKLYHPEERGITNYKDPKD